MNTMKDENDSVTIDGVDKLAAEDEATKISGRRTANTKTPDAIRQKWQTPSWLVAWVNKDIGPLARDVAADSENTVCLEFIDEAQDALNPEVVWGKKGDIVWCNPPYAEPLPWIKAAARNAKQHGVKVVMLLNYDHSTEWFYEFLQVGNRIINIVGEPGTYGNGNEKFNNGRVAFARADNKKIGPKNSKPSSLYIIEPRKSGPLKVEFISKGDMIAAAQSLI